MPNKFLSKAISYIEEHGKYPRMYARTKEAFLCSVAAPLCIFLEDFEVVPFYCRHLKCQGSAILNLDDEIEDDWARRVVKDALKRMELAVALDAVDFWIDMYQKGYQSKLELLGNLVEIWYKNEEFREQIIHAVPTCYPFRTEFEKWVENFKNGAVIMLGKREVRYENQ